MVQRNRFGRFAGTWGVLVCVAATNVAVNCSGEQQFECMCVNDYGFADGSEETQTPGESFECDVSSEGESWLSDQVEACQATAIDLGASEVACDCTCNNGDVC